MPFQMQNTRPGACDKGKVKWSETFATSESVPFLLDGLCPLSATIVPVGGSTGKLQVTTGTRAQIEAGAASWADWPPGVVAAVTTAIIDSPVTAIKAILSTGASITYNLVG